MSTDRNTISTRNQKTEGAMDEIKTMIANMDTKFTSSFSNLDHKYDLVVKGLDDLEQSIGNKLQSLETKLTADVLVVKEMHSDLKQIVSADARENAEKFMDVDERITQLEEANEIINDQAQTIIRLEKDLHRGLQHNRKWNIEIDGIPDEVGDEIDDLEAAVVKICVAIGVPITAADIEACHRLNSRRAGPHPTIVRFLSRKNVAKVMEKKSKLKSIPEIGLELPGLNPNSKIYINPSFCPYYKSLAYNCRLLKKENLIVGVIYEDDSTLKIKTMEGDFIRIQHESDLTDRFTNFEFSKYSKFQS